MNNNDLAHKIFNALFDDDDLNEMYSAGFIAQPLGYQVSSVATIEVELDNNHDRMMEEIKELRDFVRMVADADSASDEVKSFMVHSFVHNAKQLLAKLNQEGEE